MQTDPLMGENVHVPTPSSQLFPASPQKLSPSPTSPHSHLVIAFHPPVRNHCVDPGTLYDETQLEEQSREAKELWAIPHHDKLLLAVLDDSKLGFGPDVSCDVKKPCVVLLLTRNPIRIVISTSLYFVCSYDQTGGRMITSLLRVMDPVVAKRQQSAEQVEAIVTALTRQLEQMEINTVPRETDRASDADLNWSPIIKQCRDILLDPSQPLAQATSSPRSCEESSEDCSEELSALWTRFPPVSRHLDSLQQSIDL